MDSRPLNVLIVEDNPSDAELMLRELRRAGFAPDWRRVDTEADFSTNLDPKIDIILSDYSMPQFSGLRALELVNERRLAVPFIIVSGSIGEDTAVAAMRSGASDYLLKDRLARLGQAVEGALEQKQLRDERKQAEERLREQSDIINRAQDAVIIRNFETDRITFWNRGAERVYGWSASEAIGRPMGELIFTESNEREALLERLVSTGEFRGEIKHRAKDGRDVIVNSRATLIRNDDGTPRAVLGINTDITEQKSLEMQLLRAQRLESIGTLASGVAHDLNNILTPILMCAETLRTNSDPDDAQTALSLIEESARRGASVVKQVLTFARGIEGERVTINPRHLIEEMVDIARKTFPKSIEINSRYAEEVWSVQGDPTQLHQVLLNLSVNARDAMPNGGSLLLAAENINVDEEYAAMMSSAQVGPHVLLTVRDTGVGMPRATIDKIFDPFFTTKKVGKGTGLGLSTALGIVKSHGGVLSVYSEIGTGTTFKILLPAQVSEQISRKFEALPELMNGHGELVLVVDDEPNILSVTKMILEKHNYDILDANDGTEALALIAQQKDAIKLVLTDISMPYMDGVALVRTIKKMNPDTKFIASTGQGEETRVAELQSLGVTNFLIKPYDTDRLLKTLGHALEGKPDAPSEC
ncbi:MAG: response regulator [Chthoniobacterales bacterium]